MSPEEAKAKFVIFPRGSFWISELFMYTDYQKYSDRHGGSKSNILGYLWYSNFVTVVKRPTDRV